jgi:predicted porin
MAVPPHVRLVERSRDSLTQFLCISERQISVSVTGASSPLMNHSASVDYTEYVGNSGFTVAHRDLKAKCSNKKPLGRRFAVHRPRDLQHCGVFARWTVRQTLQLFAGYSYTRGGDVDGVDECALYNNVTLGMQYALSKRSKERG